MVDSREAVDSRETGETGEAGKGEGQAGGKKAENP